MRGDEIREFVKGQIHVQILWTTVKHLEFILSEIGDHCYKAVSMRAGTQKATDDISCSYYCYHYCGVRISSFSAFHGSLPRFKGIPEGLLVAKP